MCHPEPFQLSRISLTCILEQVRTPAGCSKSPSSKAAGESKPEAYPLGYVEDFDEPRTKLADFFEHSARGVRASGDSLCL